MMPVKRKPSESEQKTYLCYICGKEIHGDHVYIKTKRRTELHIHFECVPGKATS
nr:MAG TPA: Vacuolar sorting protein 39 domain 2 [Caudoviricetes sp.]